MLAQGKDGAQGETGPQGSAANVPAWVKAYTASAEFDTLVTDEWVVTMNLFGSKIFGTEIYGGKITSDTTIDVGTDATIGRWLKLKSPTGKGQVGIVFMEMQLVRLLGCGPITTNLSTLARNTWGLLEQDSQTAV